MQRSGVTQSQNASSSFFSGNFFGGNGSKYELTSGPSTSRSRPTTSSGETSSRPSGFDFGLPPPLPGRGDSPSKQAGEQLQQQQQQQLLLPRERNVLTKVRKASFSSPSKSKRRTNSSGSISVPAGSLVVTDNSAPPALPDYALAAAAKVSRDTEALQSPHSADSFPRMPSSRGNPVPAGGYATNSGGGGGGGALAAAAAAPSIPQGPSGASQQVESSSSAVHQHIQETANKRISTLDYLRKAHEGRLYWFNTLLFDKPDLLKMPYFDSRKLARRATNYLLLGLSLPTVIDLYSSNPLEYLRSLNTLLAEFDAFQQLHGENGASGSLSRARLPHMFRRNPVGSSKSRRVSSAASEIGYPLDSADGGSGGPVGGGIGGGGPGAMSTVSLSTAGGAASSAGAGGSGMVGNGSVINFAAGSEAAELLPGEEYTHLLTPSLPFDPDFFETFATLCDVLIDAYTKLVSLLHTPKDCSAPVAELFSKADSKVRKIIIQGVVKEFEDSTRTGARTEVANVGKVVLGGLL